MKTYEAKCCTARSYYPFSRCPDCGRENPEWREVMGEVVLVPDVPKGLEIIGDVGSYFFRRFPQPTGMGRLTFEEKVSSEARYAVREQFFLSWEGDRCWIYPPAVAPKNTTVVQGEELTAPRILQQCDVIALRGKSGRCAMPLVVIYR